MRETSLQTPLVEVEEKEVVLMMLEQMSALQGRAGGHALKDSAGSGEPTLELACPEGLQPVEREEG